MILLFCENNRVTAIQGIRRYSLYSLSGLKANWQKVFLPMAIRRIQVFMAQDTVLTSSNGLEQHGIRSIMRYLFLLILEIVVARYWIARVT